MVKQPATLKEILDSPETKKLESLGFKYSHSTLQGDFGNSHSSLYGLIESMARGGNKGYAVLPVIEVRDGKEVLLGARVYYKPSKS